MNPAMEERSFGRTGERTTVLGLGGACLDKYSLRDGIATVRRALELGITYFDTSPHYGQGASQVILGKALEKCQQPYMLATKLGYLATPHDFCSPDALRAQLWENLRALRRENVDVLQIHIAELACWWEDGVACRELLNIDGNYDFTDAPVMQVLREAKARGLCRFIGITADQAAELALILRHVDVDACLLAWNYDLLSRRARRTVLPVAREKGIAYITAGVLAKFTEVHPEWLSAPPLWVTPEVSTRLVKLYDLQKASGLSLLNMAVRYMIADLDVSIILIGAARPGELEECVTAAQEGSLPPDLYQRIEELGLP